MLIHRVVGATRSPRPLVFLALGVALAFFPSPSHATPITVPPGLSPGAQYYLAFVTSGTRDALSPNIEAYDLFVNQQAALSTSQAVRDITWKAVGSTASVDAISHLQLAQFPIYLLDGATVIATGGAALWSGNISAPINLDQNRQEVTSSVWTGSTPSGTGQDGNTLGAFEPVVGYSAFSSFRWVTYIQSPTSEFWPLYAVSEIQTVPVPEPSSLPGCVALALGAAVYGSRRVGRSFARSLATAWQACR